MPILAITEGVSGTHYYHLSELDNLFRGLCGAPTMATSLPADTWGIVGHLHERYCSRCEVQAVARQRVTGKDKETKKSS
jgi:hypothetical protein